ncbi:segregation/condensation protein A [Amphibacillus sp. Q70]|uniref:segregation/condensation protein A n=1 Tax=Amphibacillus sp. Q70 TaxID=3453416 RepID=UPI003F8392A5
MIESYHVRIDGFEGPLDLLLHLIKQYEIDIYDIPVAEITAQYMAYIDTMQKLDLNIASEYLVMAATLLAIKSEMLLPNQEIDEDDNYEEGDPREELIARLIEYRRYKEAAEQLKEIEGEEKESFTRSPEKMTEKTNEKQPIKKNAASIYDMLAAMQNIFNRQKWNRSITTTVEKIEIPLQQRMDEVLDIVELSEEGIPFDQLFPYSTKSHIIVTFMAMLELMKQKLVYCEQKQTFDQLILHKWR